MHGRSEAWNPFSQPAQFMGLRFPRPGGLRAGWGPGVIPYALAPCTLAALDRLELEPADLDQLASCARPRVRTRAIWMILIYLSVYLGVDRV